MRSRPRRRTIASGRSPSGSWPCSSGTRAGALRWWRAGYQAGHQAAEHEQQAAARWDHLVASYRAQHAADQQARIDALLLEIIDVLARLLSSHDNGET